MNIAHTPPRRTATSSSLIPMMITALVSAVVLTFFAGLAAAKTAAPARLTPRAAAAKTAAVTAVTLRTPIWVGDYNSGTFSQFSSSTAAPTAPAIVASPRYEGAYGGKYVVPAGGSRSESVPALRALKEGDDLWFGWSTMLGTDVPMTIGNWQVLAEWKNTGPGSPPIELKLSNGQYVLDGGYGWPGSDTPQPRYTAKTIGAAKAGVWERWTAHIKFSSKASTGMVEMWRNGTKVITNLHLAGGTLYPRLTSYLQVGYYRDPAITKLGTVYHDAWKVGTTQASVAASPTPEPVPTSSPTAGPTSGPAPSPSSSTSAPTPSPSSSSSTPAPSPTSSSSTPTPTPSTSTSTSSSPPVVPPLWTGDYNSGSLSQFDSTSWNNVPLAPSVVASPAYDGGYAGKYVIPAGGSRCENVPTLRSFSEGDDYWFGWSTYLASDFPVNVSNWQVINQWKNDGTGSPPIELKVGNGQFSFDGGYGWPGNTSSPSPKYYSVAIGSARTGVWDRWVAHIKFSSTASIGTVDLWRNGVQVISGLHMPGGTLYPGLSSYLKIGYYRDSAISTQGTVYHDAWKVGTTQASVS